MSRWSSFGSAASPLQVRQVPLGAVGCRPGCYTRCYTIFGDTDEPRSSRESNGPRVQEIQRDSLGIWRCSSMRSRRAGRNRGSCPLRHQPEIEVGAEGDACVPFLTSRLPMALQRSTSGRVEKGRQVALALGRHSLSKSSPRGATSNLKSCRADGPAGH